MSTATAMKTLIILGYFLYAAAGQPLNEPPALRMNPLFPNGRIVGGVDTDITKIPYQVALEYHGSHFCGGTLINENYVLTASHCLITNDMTVRIGSSIRGENGVVYSVLGTVGHPKYSEKTLDYDVAVLRLTTRVELSDKIKPIPLIDSEPLPPSKILVSGWGLTWEDGKCSEQLQSVQISVYPRQKCGDIYSKFNLRITPRMLCAYDLGKDACQGDSGGPAVVNGKIAGIVSWGVGCARPNFPGVYTNVADPDIRRFICDYAQV